MLRLIYDAASSTHTSETGAAHDLDHDLDTVFDTTRYESLYETAPEFITQLIAATVPANEMCSNVTRSAPRYQAPATRPFTDAEQAQALLIDCERHDDIITTTIRETSGRDTNRLFSPLLVAKQ